MLSAFFSGVPVEQVWSEHLSDEAALWDYSRAMYRLASGPWASKHGGGEEGRITWCVDTCCGYFDCTLEHLVKKDLRRVQHGSPTQLLPAWLPSTEEEVGRVVGEFASRKLSLLDVGSCYNPFALFDRFSVTAIDIAPAVEVRDNHYCNSNEYNLPSSSSSSSSSSPPHY